MEICSATGRVGDFISRCPAPGESDKYHLIFDGKKRNHGFLVELTNVITNHSRVDKTKCTEYTTPDS